MAEVGTFVQAARELLIALNHTKVASVGIGATFLDWAADLRALVLLTLLDLIANTLALYIVNRIHLLLRHHLQA